MFILLHYLQHMYMLHQTEGVTTATIKHSEAIESNFFVQCLKLRFWGIKVTYCFCFHEEGYIIIIRRYLHLHLGERITHCLS